MNKDNELKRPNHTKRNQEDKTAETPVSPDTSAPMGYINDRPLRDKLSKEQVDKKSMGGSPDNEVELSLNPDEENPTEDEVLDEGTEN